MRRDRPLWQCPSCGNLFVTPNMWHSCIRVPIADHFSGKDPMVRQLYDRILEVVRTNGPVRVVSQKTRICFQVRVRFAGVLTRKHWIDCGLWLTRRARHPCCRRVDEVVKGCYVHYLRFSTIQQVDTAFADLVSHAYRVGRQEHLKT